MKNNRVPFMGICIDNMDANEIVNHIFECVERRKPVQVVGVNVDQIVTVNKSDVSRNIFLDAEIVFIDGKPIKWMCSLLNRYVKERITGPDLMEYICEKGAAKELKIFLLGAGPGVAKRCGEILETKYPGSLYTKEVVNISFLFPFCLWGYFNKNIASIGWRQGMASLLIFICLFVFVWKPEYSIWRSGGYILQDSSHMIKVVLIRLAIGGTGIYSAVFLWERLYNYCKDETFVKLIYNIGKETLAVYLMQHIVVEILLLKTVRTLGIRGMFDGQQLFAGYILTPILSFVLLVIMYYAVDYIKRYKHTKWIFGFKLKTEAYRFL